MRQSTISVEEAERQTPLSLRLLPRGEHPRCVGTVLAGSPIPGEIHARAGIFLSIIATLMSVPSKNWRSDGGGNHAAVREKGSHLALDDIKESISELQFYRQHFFSVGAL